MFAAAGFHARALGSADLASLQAFFEANPDYFLIVTGEPPRADDARQLFDDRPPSDMPFDRCWLIGYLDSAGHPVGMAQVLSDLLAPGVWHIGLFIVATALHGSGAAALMYGALEGWIRQGGARWIRLGVVVGNHKAERFWASSGYEPVRLRTGVRMGPRSCTVRLYVKPLAAAGLPAYLALVARDQPGSTAP